jgi:hypothetical protein
MEWDGWKQPLNTTTKLALTRHRRLKLKKRQSLESFRANEQVFQQTCHLSNELMNQPTFLQPTVRKSSNDPTNQPANKSSNQQTCRRAKQPTNERTSRLYHQSTDRSINQPINQPTNQPTLQPSSLPTNQRASPPPDESTDNKARPKINRLINT